MPCNKSLQNDMSDMSHIHEPAILYNISRKYLQRHEFYTYIGGKVLVSLNPLTWEYPPMSMDRIVTGNCADIPHPFVFAGFETKQFLHCNPHLYFCACIV